MGVRWQKACAYVQAVTNSGEIFSLLTARHYFFRIPFRLFTPQLTAPLSQILCDKSTN